MEERIIDDEYGRGIRLKKTKDGYVDATDELALEKDDGETQQDGAVTAEAEADFAKEEESGTDREGDETETADEVLFEFPEEDDEELAALSAEDAAALIKKRGEERKKREDKAHALCEAGEALLNGADDEETYKKAAEAFDEALCEMPSYARAALGFWRAKTCGGRNLQPLLDEWAAAGYDEFEATFGEECAKTLKEEWKDTLEAERTKREEAIAPMQKEFEEKTEKRRVILKERTYDARKKFIPLLSVEIALLVFAAVFAMNVFSRSDAVFVWLSAACGGAFVLALPFFCIAASRFFHASSLSHANEVKSSTKEGRALQKEEDEFEFLSRMIG
ncbi:MAG: hypothetical protein ACI4SH_09610 [Candidatus Scatosoma sp.]